VVKMARSNLCVPVALKIAETNSFAKNLIGGFGIEDSVIWKFGIYSLVSK
jgi:hypothetical protein